MNIWNFLFIGRVFKLTKVNFFKSPRYLLYHFQTLKALQFGQMVYLF